MGDAIRPDGYRLGRGYAESNRCEDMNEFVLPARNDTDCGLRLNSQQFIWKAVCGYNIHPTILAASNQKLKVADVGTGTGRV